MLREGVRNMDTKKLLWLVLGGAILIFALWSIATRNVDATYTHIDKCQGDCITYELQCPDGYEETDSRHGECKKWKWIIWPVWGEWRYTDKVEVCTEYEDLCIEPSLTPTPTEPQPTQPPTRIITDTSNPHIACVADKPEELPRNAKVIRNGSSAVVSADIPEGDKVNVYYRANSDTEYNHAIGDVPVFDDGIRRFGVEINDLDPNIGYTFAIAASNSCNEGELVAVVVDPPAQGQTFLFSYWDILN